MMQTNDENAVEWWNARIIGFGVNMQRRPLDPSLETKINGGD